MTSLVFNIKDIAVLMSAFIATLFGIFFLLSKFGNRHANWIFAAFLFVQSASSIVSLILYTPVAAGLFDAIATANILYMEGILILLEGFLLYYLTKSLLFKDFSWHRQVYIHIFLLLTILGFSFIYIRQQEVTTTADILIINSKTIGTANIYVLLQLSRCLYACLCFLNINRYQNRLKDKYSNMERADLSWLKFLIGGYLLARIGWSLIPTSLVISYYSNLHFATFTSNVSHISFLFDVIWLVTLSALLYFGLHYSPQFEGFKEIQSHQASSGYIVNKKHIARIEKYMHEQKPYFSADLKLDELATKIALPAKTLSILLNVHYKKNFCEFINYYRIQEAASILSNPDLRNKPVLDISLEVGFNSKSAFNRSFKKVMGSTPQNYRRQLDRLETLAHETV